MVVRKAKLKAGTAGVSRQSFAIDDHLLRRLKLAAFDKKTSQEKIVLEAVRAYLDQHEGRK